MAIAIYEVAQTVDATGKVCPTPVLMLAKAIRVLQSGQILALLATDQGAKADVPAWADKTGNALLETTEANGVMTFYIRKV